MSSRISSRISVATGSVLVVASALVLLAASTMIGCSGSGSSYSPTAPTGTSPYTAPSDPGSGVADVTISIAGMNGAQSYSPNPATVKVGQTVAWRNADSVAHTATADGGAFDTATIAAGAKSNPILMATAGSFPYHCSIHGSMTGTLVVTP